MMMKDIYEKHGYESLREKKMKDNLKKQGRMHGIRCVLACTASNFRQKLHFCRISTCV